MVEYMTLMNASKPEIPLTVLVVEDEVLLAMELESRLTRLGYQVVSIVDTGEKAIQHAEIYQPGLILMDIRLKGQMDGIEAADVIRRRMDIPIVYLASHSDAGTLSLAPDTVPFGYVLKPHEERELFIAMEVARQRHALEKRLRENEKRYIATLSSIGDGVAATDAEGRITFMNAIAEDLTGWKLEEVQGESIERVFAPIDEDGGNTLENPVRRALHERQILQLTGHALLNSREQEPIPIDHSAAPIITDSDEVIGAVVAFRDVSQRLQAEDALRIAKDELHRAQRLESLGRLSGGVAHDFNNLLTVINGYCSLLLDDNQLDAKSQDLVKRISSAGESAAKLTNQLLAFGRGQLLKAERIDLNEIVREMHSLLLRVIGENIQIELNLDPVIGQVIADPAQVEQIIINLVTNARDAMEDGGRVVLETSKVYLTKEDARSRKEIKPGRYVRLAVTDFGMGFDETVRDRLFEPFFSTKEKGRGTGLGLATVYGIVKQSGGYIYASSIPGEGATFEVFLPSALKRSAEKPAVISVSFPLKGGSETILLVEDEESVRAFSATLLRRLGYRVVEALHGEDALQIASDLDDEIHLLMTDVVMPGMGGREVAEQLKISRPGLRVLYLSGYTSDQTLRHGIFEGEVAFLQKPFTVATLANKVRDTLEAENVLMS